MKIKNKTASSEQFPNTIGHAQKKPQSIPMKNYFTKYSMSYLRYCISGSSTTNKYFNKLKICQRFHITIKKGYNCLHV